MKKIHHFILKNFSLSKGRDEIVDKEFIHQVCTVLKLKVGEEIIVGDGRGKEGKSVIRNMNKKVIQIEIQDVQSNPHELSFTLRLYCSILKRENFEWVVQKATELGVIEITPIVAARTIKSGLNSKRLEKIALESAEQCERGVTPVIREPMRFEEVLKDTLKYDGVFMFEKTGTDSRDAINRVSAKRREIAVFIGPEGGWTEEELGKARKQGIHLISLGQTMLRAETAAVVSCFWASRMLG